MSDDLVKRIDERAKKHIAATPSSLLMEAADRIEELEAKLAEAVSRLEKLSYWLNLDDEELAACSLDELAGDYRKIQDEVNDILSELRGESANLPG